VVPLPPRAAIMSSNLGVECFPIVLFPHLVIRHQARESDSAMAEEEKQQDHEQHDADAAARTPLVVTVPAAPTAEDEQQNNQ
jgi:hypothetical protein